MYEKILVPLDGSDLAEIALPYAEELAGTLGSEVTLIQVSESAKEKHYHMPESYMDEMVEATKQGAERYREKPSTKKIKVNSVDLVGYIAERIVDYANKEKIGQMQHLGGLLSGVLSFLLFILATTICIIHITC